MREEQSLLEGRVESGVAIADVMQDGEERPLLHLIRADALELGEVPDGKGGFSGREDVDEASERRGERLAPHQRGGLEAEREHLAQREQERDLVGGQGVTVVAGEDSGREEQDEGGRLPEHADGGQALAGTRDVGGGEVRQRHQVGRQRRDGASLQEAETRSGTEHRALLQIAS